MLKLAGGFAVAAIAIGLVTPQVLKTTDAAPAPLAAVVSGTPETVRLPTDARGHARADVEIDGRRVEMMVDTGASIIALRYEDAERAGLLTRGVNFTSRVSTANGTARVAPIRLSRVKIGGIVLYDVEAVVAERGALGTNLLGMSFLKRLSKVEVTRNAIVLAK